MSQPKKSVISAAILREIGENAFPDVVEECPVCHGRPPISSVHGLTFTCPTCKGHGFITREMTAREEHYWIIHVIKGIQSEQSDFRANYLRR